MKRENTTLIDFNVTMKPQRLIKLAGKLGTALCCTLLLASCNVTNPDGTVWDNVANFSWPTELGTSMKYRVDTAQEELTVELADPTISYLAGMYVLQNNDLNVALAVQVHYRPSHDTLIVAQDKLLAADIALLAPLEKGHSWVASYDSTWQAEIIERFAYRKVDGKIYENVIAVKYVKYENGNPGNTEWIRFFAEGVGEILTIRNSYPDSNAPTQTLPRQEVWRELIEIDVAAN